MPGVTTKIEEPYPSAWRTAALDSSLEVLEVRLRGADTELRGRTAFKLREVGPEAVPALCEALKDPDLAVRAAVAESLAEIGDARALAPLAEALKRCANTHDARKTRFQILTALIFLVVFLAVVLGQSFKLQYLGTTMGGWFALVQAHQMWVRSRQERGPQIVMLTQAIDRIASREPTPELRTLLPELEAVAADPLLHTASTRAATREVAGRIAALTERIKSMPVAAEAPQVEPEQLPIAAAPR